MDLKNKDEIVGQNEDRLEKNNDDDKQSEIYNKIFSFHGLMILAFLLVGLFILIYWLQKIDKIAVFVNIVFYEIALLAFLGIMIVIAIRYFFVIQGILKGKERQGMHIISALILLFFSFLGLKKYSFSINDIMDFLAEGQLFVAPILFLIVMSVSIIFAATLENMFSDEMKEKIDQDAQKILDKIIKIGGKIVNSLLDQIEFVLLDYFPQIKSIVLGEADVDSFEVEGREQAKHIENSGERANTGTAEQAGVELKEGVERTGAERGKDDKL